MKITVKLFLGFISLSFWACTRDQEVSMEQCMSNLFLKNDTLENNVDLESCVKPNLDYDDIDLFDALEVTLMGFRGGDVELADGSSFRIALLDKNNNGVYSDEGVDKVFLLPEGTDSALVQTSPYCVPIEWPFTFSVKGQHFELKEISKSGRSIRLGKSNLGIEPVLEYPFVFFDNELASLTESEMGDPVDFSRDTYIYFFSPTCKPCRQYVPKLHLMEEKHTGSINVKYLSRPECAGKANILSYARKEGIENSLVYARDTSFYQKFDLVALSDGILVDGNGDVSKVHLSPGELLRQYPVGNIGH